MNFGQRNHIFTLETLSSPNTCFIRVLQPSLVQMLNEWNENVFRVVFLKSDVRIDGVLLESDLLVLGMPGSLLAGVRVEIELNFFPITMHMVVT